MTLKIHTTVQKFGLVRFFKMFWEVFYAQSLHLFDQKYSKKQ